MQVTDPVRGKTVDLGAAEWVEHHGWAYFFSSAACRTAFLVVQDRYALFRPESAPPHRDAVKPRQPAQ